MTPNSTLKKVSQERVQEVIRLYNEGYTAMNICVTLKMTSRTVKKILEVYGIKKDRASLIQFGKNGSIVNHNILNELTPDALYWIGFLYADGHIEKNKKRINLTLSEVDYNHLEKFNNFFGKNLTIQNVTGNKSKNSLIGQINFNYKYFRAGFSSKKIYERLQELGFTNNKTLNLIPHELLKNSRDFWRGVVDGDGWLCNTKPENPSYSPIIGLSGTKDTCDDFIRFINSFGLLANVNSSKNKRSNVYTVDIHSKKVPLILNLLYKNANTYLERKYQKYLTIIN
jgi:hypothetical protein